MNETDCGGPIANVFQARLDRRHLLKVAALTSGAVSLAGVVAPYGVSRVGAQEPPRGGTLVVRLDSDIIGVDPHGASAGIDRNVYTSVYDGLVTVDENLNIVPSLAESFETPDDRTYIFKLRPNVTFHDGTVCDAAAVKWNFDWILDEVNASPRRSELVDIQEVLVDDPLTVRIILKNPFAPFLAIISDRAGYIVSPAARQQYGADYQRNPVGTGPFRFVEWVKDDHITFRRFEEHWEEGVPYLDEIRYRPIPDATVALTELKTNNIDFFFGIDPKDVEDVKSTPNLQYLEGLGVGYQGLWINMVQGPLANKALREAVAFAVDREALFAAAYYGVGQIAHGPIPPSSWAFDPDFRSRSRDLDQAKAKLVEGGQPNGFPLVLKVANTPLGRTITQIVQANLKEIGIAVEIQTLEFGALLEAGEQGAFDALSLGWSGRIDPDGNIQPIFHSGGAFNYGNYNNPQVDQLIADGRATTDREERTRIYREIQRIVNDDAAYVFTYFPPASFGAADYVQGFTVTPDALMRFRTTAVDKS